MIQSIKKSICSFRERAGPFVIIFNDSFRKFSFANGEEKNSVFANRKNIREYEIFANGTSALGKTGSFVMVTNIIPGS